MPDGTELTTECPVWAVEVGETGPGSIAALEKAFHTSGLKDASGAKGFTGAHQWLASGVGKRRQLELAHDHKEWRRELLNKVVDMHVKHTLPEVRDAQNVS